MYDLLMDNYYPSFTLLRVQNNFSLTLNPVHRVRDPLSEALVHLVIMILAKCGL
jgi:hypothetical protein